MLGRLLSRKALAEVNEYDRGRYPALRAAIARRHGLDVDQVALGAGSDEFIVLLARLFAEGATIATVPAYSYSMYRYAALMADATIVEDPSDGRPRLRLSSEQPDRRASRRSRGHGPARHRRGLR